MPTLASSSLASLAYIKEVTFGVIPAAGTPKFLRMTGESLDYAITKDASKEINSSRATTSMVPTQASASGGVNAELSYAEYDPLLESTLQSAYAVYGTNGVGTSFAGTFTATTITAGVAPTGASAFTTLKKGQFIQLQTAGGTNDFAIVRVSLTVAPSSTVITLEASTPLVVGTAAATTVSTSRLTHGTTQTSWSLERQANDVTEYWAYSGMTPSSFDMKVAKGALSSLNFNFMGAKATHSGTATLLPGAPTASKTYDVQTGVTGSAGTIYVDNVALTSTFITDISLKFDNALRAQTAIGNLAAVGIGAGTISVSGSLQVYLASGDTLYDKFVANTNIALSFSTSDTAGNGYVVTIPQANLTKVTVTAGSKDQDMMLAIDWTGLQDAANADATLRKVIFIDRVGATVV